MGLELLRILIRLEGLTAKTRLSTEILPLVVAEVEIREPDSLLPALMVGLEAEVTLKTTVDLTKMAAAERLGRATAEGLGSMG